MADLYGRPTSDAVALSLGTLTSEPRTTKKETQMKTLAALLVLAAVPSLASAEEAWRWKDANGTVCYSNRAEVAPPDATLVKTRLIVETDRLPGAPELVTEDGMVTDAVEQRPEAPVARK